jgi:hypothetical protein
MKQDGQKDAENARKLAKMRNLPDFPKTVGPSVLTDRNAVGPTISKYISDRMSGKT